MAPEQNIPVLRTAAVGAHAAGRIAGRAVGRAGAAIKKRLIAEPKPLTRGLVAHQGAVAAGLGLTLGTTLLYFWLSDEEKKAKKNGDAVPKTPIKPVGRPLCPFETADASPDLSGIKAGDFVIVTLSNKPNTLRESTWAEVLGFSEGRITVQLTGQARPGVEVGLTVVPKSLKTEWHGFHIGQKLFLSADCIWDVLHSNPQAGSILCGQQGTHAFKSPPLTKRFLLPGFRVRIATAPPQGRVSEPLWTEVLSISTTGSVITARILDVPTIGAHGFRQGDVVEFARDCIFAVQAV